MSENQQKETILKLNEKQFNHLLVILSDINQGIKNIVDKQIETNKRLENLETAIVRVEAELKLIRIEISELKEKIKK